MSVSFGKYGQLKCINVVLNEENSLTVTLFGGHVVSWVASGKEQLFVSNKARLDGSKAIRGGIPLIFPQFSNRGPLPSHGFLRTSTGVSFDSCSVTEDRIEVVLVQEDQGDAHRFLFRLHLTLTVNTLAIGVQVTAKETPFTFSGALHSYFLVADVRNVSVHGFQGVRYQDHLKDKQELVDDRAAATIATEVDRTYMNVPPSGVQIVEGPKKLQLTSTWKDAVLWNPWIDKSKRMGDFGDEEYLKMVCVEVGQVTENVTVAPRTTWEANHVLQLAPSSSL